jgi:transcription antitermination factor NusG
MTYHIGQTLPPAPSMYGEEIDPTWYVLTTLPQKERNAQAWLERSRGVIEAWYPTERAWRGRPGGRTPYERAIAPRYLFTLFHRAPMWHLLFDAGRDKVSGVVSRYGEPMPIGEDAIAKMQHLPKRLDALHRAAEAQREAERLAKAPRVGDAAEFTQGPLSGRLVDVSRIHAGIAWVILGGVEVKADVSALQRVAG